MERSIAILKMWDWTSRFRFFLRNFQSVASEASILLSYL